MVKLYNPNSPDEPLSGEDVNCRVTILDEDFPGTIQFQQNEITVSST